jgi:hypothetical protein
MHVFRLKLKVHIPTPGNEPGAIVIDIRECSESIVLQFENVIGMVECVTSEDWLCWVNWRTGKVNFQFSS